MHAPAAPVEHPSDTPSRLPHTFASLCGHRNGPWLSPHCNPQCCLPCAASRPSPLCSVTAARLRARLATPPTLPNLICKAQQPWLEPSSSSSSSSSCCSPATVAAAVPAAAGAPVASAPKRQSAQPAAARIAHPARRRTTLHALSSQHALRPQHGPPPQHAQSLQHALSLWHPAAHTEPAAFSEPPHRTAARFEPAARLETTLKADGATHKKQHVDRLTGCSMEQLSNATQLQTNTLSPHFTLSSLALSTPPCATLLAETAVLASDMAAASDARLFTRHTPHFTPPE